MSKKPPRKRTVIVVLWLAGSAGRKQLTGILSFVRNGHPWSIHLVSDPKSFDNAAILQAESDGVDGLIAHVENGDSDALATSSIPTVLLDFPPPKVANRKRSIAVILDSDEQIGDVAAKYFMQLGNFASYAFIPDRLNRGWSRLRERGFSRALRCHGADFRVFGEGRGSLADWLASLPKPTAVLAAYDLMAQEAIGACREANLDVPRQVSVLGVDNDELICDYTSPSISSVRIDHEALGHEAARTLESLMNRSTSNRLKKIFMPVGAVVERESTSAIVPGTRLVQTAIDYIHEHAADGITVSDVIRRLGVSRRLADRRFGAATGSSIRRAIEERRLELVRQRLKSSDMPIQKLSRLCGYANVQRLKYVFKARFGISMTAWRKSCRAC